MKRQPNHSLNAFKMLELGIRPSTCMHMHLMGLLARRCPAARAIPCSCCLDAGCRKWSSLRWTASASLYICLSTSVHQRTMYLVGQLGA